MAPDTPLSSVKCLRNNPKSIPRRSHIRITKPALEAKQGVASLSDTSSASRRPTSWSMVILSSRKIRKNKAKERNIEISKVDTEDHENTYGIDHLKIGEAKHDLDDFE